MKSSILGRHKIRELRAACKNDAGAMCSLIEQKMSLPDDDPKRLRPDNFSLREIAEGLGGNTEPYSEQDIFSEAVTASQFATIIAKSAKSTLQSSFKSPASVYRHGCFGTKRNA